MQRSLTLLAVLAFSFVGVFAQPSSGDRLLMGRIALNQTHVAFTYAGKIWLVPRNGGEAKRLTNTPNEETSPVFSPDGSRIAFSRSNGNDWDIFVMNADGSGEPFRATIMPEDDFVTSWTPDGKELIFETTRDEENVVRLYRTSAERSTLATALPLHRSYMGSMSPDGSRIAFNPFSGVGDGWRYYRGGNTSRLWIADLKGGAVEKVSNGESNDRSPIWVGDKIYFLSDRTGSYNLYAYDTSSRKTRAITNSSDKAIRWASVFRDTAAYVQDGQIHLMNLLPAGADELVNFTVSPDTSELAARNAPAARSLESILPSPKGDRIAIGARGDVFVFDPATAAYKNLTNTPGVAERYPAISPDGKLVAYTSDESGEYSLHVRSLENDTVKKIAIEQRPSFYWDLRWSPDSTKVVFNDRRLGFWMINVPTGTTTKIDTSSYTGQDTWTASFSPDSRYIAYAKTLKNRVGTIFVYDIAGRKSLQITDGLMHAESPAFDSNGKYLYFVSSSNAGTTDFPWGVLNSTLSNPLVFGRVNAFVLTQDEPLPLTGNGQPNPEAKPTEVVSQVRIDLDGMQKRLITLPLPARDYNFVATGKPGRLLLGTNEWPAAPGDFGARQTTTIYSFDLAKGGQWTKSLTEIDSADLTGDATKVLYRKGRDFFLTSIEEPVKPDAGRLDLSKMEVRVVPADEWKQMFHESMRIMRDWFYDTNYHGQNLTSLEREYARYLPTITRRSDLNALMRQMLGSVSVSHLGIGGGDAPGPRGERPTPIGLLGADYEVSNGKYRFKKIFRSTSYQSPNGSANAPLDATGVDVREGDYILSVNDHPVDGGKNILSYFENTTNKPTKLTVSSSPDGSNPRTYTVFPAAGENRLRRANWAEENRKLVEKISGGKLGYIFIEGYNGEGVMNAIRGLTGYGDKNGVIIDQRFNGGGITPDYLIEWMQRRPLYYYMFRGGDDIATPVNPAPPVKVMLINEMNGSAAETGAFMFKLGKVGPIVGKRTYGGGIGPYFFTPSLIDGGRVQLPGRAAYDPSGTGWGIENVGVAPDYDVDITPADVIAGRDPQLLKAIDVAMAQVAKNPIYAPKHPLFPVHPGAQPQAAGGDVLIASLPRVGSAFPTPSEVAPRAQPAAASAPSGKFANYIGKYDGGEMGVLVVREEKGKLQAVAPSGEYMELVPDSTADKFIAQPIGAPVAFERDAGGNIIAIVVNLPNGRQEKGRKMP